jgi:amidase
MVVGPLGRSIADIELCMELLVRPRPAERRAWSINLPKPRHANLSGYRIGLWADDPGCTVDRSVKDSISKAVETISGHGAIIEEVKPDIDFSHSHAVYLSLLAAVMGAGTPDAMFSKWLEGARALCAEDQGYLARHLRGATQFHRDWALQDLERQRLKQKWADFFTRFDALICPPCPVPAIGHDHRFMYDRTLLINGEERPYMDAVAWAGLAGVAGLPATVLPVGRTPDGLPVGMQIIGPYLEDRTPIHLARLFSEISGGYEPPPGY